MTTPIVLEKITAAPDGGYLHLRIPLKKVTGLQEALEVKSQLQTVISAVIDNFEKRTGLPVDSVDRYNRTIEGRSTWRTTIKF